MLISEKEVQSFFADIVGNNHGFKSIATGPHDPAHIDVKAEEFGGAILRFRFRKTGSMWEVTATKEAWCPHCGGSGRYEQPVEPIMTGSRNLTIK